METIATNRHALHYNVTPETLDVFERHFPGHPAVVTAIEEARTRRLNYGTLAHLAALADETHAPDLAQAVLNIFTTMSSGNNHRGTLAVLQN